MTVELTYLTYVAVFTALMWLPYILNLIMVRGMKDAVGYPENPKPLAAWAQRLKAAHYNAVENLVVFAALVVIAHLAGITNECTVWAVKIYLCARVIHAIVYSAGIPWLRTLSFAAGWLAMLSIAWQILCA
ncbi:MAG: MAPEG family protein [Gammaproteobacteria bacterium]|nr:MAPEG family protein [Gammaproteobacteria bacterium]NNC98497.1 MAPEG family protein [Gammaproteobacteria bacterium]NNM13478.1 MAPEG family protein [Gammaproteobacteria bacterium]